MASLHDRLTRRILHSPWEWEGSPCWLWQGARRAGRGPEHKGYGAILVDGKLCLTHRVAWELFRGKIPAGMMIDHLCRVTLCCNPKHLEPVTAKENVARGNTVWANEQRGRERLTCKHGHDLTDPENFWMSSHGRQCKPCSAARLAKFRERLA